MHKKGTRIGLQHACKVISQGRTILRRMINLLTAFRREDHPIHLNREFHLHLTWWLEFFTSWNGQSFFLAPQWAPLSDFIRCPSGTMGYGAIPLVHRFMVSISTRLLHCVQGIVMTGHLDEWNSFLTINRLSMYVYCSQAQQKTPA